MPNYNDNDTRDNSIDQLPRMIFQLPNTESGATSPTINPVFFCQSGCAIEYNFSNIKSCQFNNDGKKFTITPTDTANINYIMWNGTDINSGEKMTQFTLKEIYFTAPAKDYLGTNTDILSQSIQFYYVFVNEKFNNLMICVSVIGSVNNLGNAPKSNGFVMMETLATRIPSINVQSQLNNLNNFNLGTLIPPNKPFFSTLITNNIQYIIYTEIIDVPIEFFSNMATMVNGGTDLYTAKMNQFKTNIPLNPPTTILFYNENSQLLNDNQNLVCNSNCDLVPGKKITPTIGTYTTTQTEKKKEDKMKTITGTEVPPEKCEMEEVWVNQTTKPVKDPSNPDGKIGDPSVTEKGPAVVAISVSFIFLLTIFTGLYVASKTQNTRIWLAIIIGILIIIPIIVGFIVGCNLYYKDNTNHWIPYVVGLIIWGSCILTLKVVSNKYSSSNYSSFNLTTVKQQPYAGITVPNGFNKPEEQSWFGKMFSSKPITNYSTQITVPSTSNTQPKKSLIDKIFKRNSQPDSTLSTSIAPTSAQLASASTANLPVSQQKQSFLSSINPFSKQANLLNPEIIQSKTELIKDIQQSILSQANKNKLIKTLNSSKSSNIVQRLNNVYKELNKLKLKST
jgi:hypothetical protein